jgi:hypothetical protein
MDTRSTTGGRPVAKVPGLGTTTFQIAGAHGVPAQNAAAAVLNLTETNARAQGCATAHPDGTARPPVSNLNHAPGRRTRVLDTRTGLPARINPVPKGPVRRGGVVYLDLPHFVGRTADVQALVMNLTMVDPGAPGGLRASAPTTAPHGRPRPRTVYALSALLRVHINKAPAIRRPRPDPADDARAGRPIHVRTAGGDGCEPRL